MLFILILYLNCCKLFEEVFNTRISKAIIVKFENDHAALAPIMTENYIKLPWKSMERC